MSSHDITLCSPFIQEKWPLFRAEYRGVYTNRDLIITCTERSPAEQWQDFLAGRTLQTDGTYLEIGVIKTRCSGRELPIVSVDVHGVRHECGRSKHNLMPAEAVDFGITVNGRLLWTDVLYEQAGPIAIKVGLGWGGSWTKGFRDIDHVEKP